MFRFPALFFATALMTQSALAATWEKIPISAGMHAHGATIEMVNAVFHIYCPEAQAEDWWYSEFQITADGVNADGPGRFHFENGQVSEVPFEDGFFRVRSSKDAKAFAEIIGRLKQNDVVLIRNEAAGDLVFSLQGASEAIGECRPRLPKNAPHSEAPAVTAAAPSENRQTVADPAGQPQVIGKAEGYDEDLKQRWLVTEQYLQALGFDPGPVDGVVGSETVMAVNAFQKAYKLEVANSLPARQFTVLEALAKANGTSLDSTTVNQSRKRVTRQNVPPQNIELRDLEALGNALRNQAGENPASTVARLKQQLRPAFHPFLEDGNIIKDFLKRSILFLGCVTDPIKVYGFYDVGQHIWLIYWIDETTKSVVDVRLSLGFEPKAYSTGTAWFEMISADATLLDSLKKAVYIQTEAFNEVFPAGGCVSSNSLETLFTGNEAAATLQVNQRDFPDRDAPLVEQMLRNIKAKYNLGDEADLRLSFFIKGFKDLDYLTGYTSAENPFLIMVQGWKTSSGVLELQSSGASILVGG